MRIGKKLMVGILTGALLVGASIPFSRSKEEPLPKIFAAQQVAPLTIDNEIEDSIILSICQNVGGYSYKIPFFASAYFDYKIKSHQIRKAAELTRYVTYNDPNIQRLAEIITKPCKTPEESAGVIMEFVHQHVYDDNTDNAYSGNYVKYPLETIVERCGDCEDLAILGAALMKAKGIDVALLEFSNGDGAGHIAIGVCGNFRGANYEVGDKKYYYAEATGTVWPFEPANWKIGQLPETGDYSTAIVYPIE